MIFLVIAQAGGIPWADLSPVVAVGLIFLAVLLALLKHNASREKLMAEAMDRQTAATTAALDRGTEATADNARATDFIGRILAVQAIGNDALMRLVARPKGISSDDVMKAAREAADARFGPIEKHR